VKSPQCFAVIPARGGSKRIPQKNFYVLHEKPLIRWVVETLQETQLFDTIFVTTDEVSRVKSIFSTGDSAVPQIVPRPPELATDESSVDEVLLQMFELHEEDCFICCVYPTNALLKSSTILKSHKTFIEDPTYGVMGVSRYRYKLEKALRVRRIDKSLVPVFPAKIRKKTQQLEDYVVSNGTFYWTSLFRMRDSGSLFSDRQKGYLVADFEVCDLDEPKDLYELETKFFSKYREIQ